MLTVSDVSVAVDGRQLIDAVSFTARAGDRVAVVGRSGSGKTTFLRTLAGVLPLRSGEVTVSPSGGRVVFVPQDPVLLGALTVVENLEVFLRAAGSATAPVDAAVSDALDTFALRPLAAKLAMELSGGEQQRLALARVAALRPAVLLADEPTARQDHDTRALVVDGLATAMADGVLVVATHDPDVRAVCGSVVEVEPTQA